MKGNQRIFDESSHLGTGQMLSYLRHRLNREEIRQVERHLADCEFCSDALEGLRKLNTDTSVLDITNELQKLARKRRIARKKLFTQLDLISVFAVIFLILLLLAVAMLMFPPGG